MSEPIPVDFLTLADALEVVDVLGFALRDLGLLEGALARPRTSIFGEDACPTVFGKAAALLDGINRAHPLVDGNKRLSWVLTRTFLVVNNWDLRVDADRAEPFVLDVAQGRLTMSTIARWIEGAASPLG